MTEWGILRGGGETAYCKVSALRVAFSGPRLFKDCPYTVLWVSKPLPEGDYKLSIDGEIIDMRHFKGGWGATQV